MNSTVPFPAASDRYIVVPCEAPGQTDLAVIWDRLEEQVVDVIDARATALAYEDEDALWDEARPAFNPAHDPAHAPMMDWRQAA
jgi:hypothetical protein